MTFESTLFECCERAGWVLHAFCIMGNHYHAAIETPRGNLIEGMRWLQSTFANRFNRYQKESGHLFQGRFKSLQVENKQRLAWLCHYIHLNPVRAGICEVSELSHYRWSSYWYLRETKQRPACITPIICLKGAGDLDDTKRGWDRYAEYLKSLAADGAAQKEMAFDRMSRGWAIGTKEFQRRLVGEMKEPGTGVRLTLQELKETRLFACEEQLEKCCSVLGKTIRDIKNEAKAANWKIAVAAFLKQRFMCTNRWLGEHLNMGTPFGVSRYLTEMRKGERTQADDYFKRLTTKVKD